MSGISTKSRKPRFKVKRLVDGKVQTKCFQSRESADAYRNQLKAVRRFDEQELVQEQQIEDQLDRLENVINQIIEQTLICQGFIRRAGVWQMVCGLNKPLTSEEQTYIRSIKARAVEHHLPPNWPEQSDSSPSSFAPTTPF